MKIDFEFIKGYLNAHEFYNSANICIYGDKGREIQRIALLRGKESRCLPHTAYICLPGDVEDPVDSSCAYILIGSDDSRFSSATRLVIMRTIPKEDVYTALVDMFYTVAHWKSTLLELVASHATVNDLVIASDEIFGFNAITVTDSSYLILGHSAYTEQEPWFHDNVRTSDNKVFAIPENADTEKTVIPDKPVAPFFATDSTYAKDVRVLRTYVFSDNGFFMAWLTVAQHQAPLHAYHKQLLEYLAKCIQMLLTNDLSGINSHTSSALYAQLLMGSPDSATVDEILLSTDWNINDRFRVLILDTQDKPIADNKIGFRLISMLSRLMPSSKFILFEHRVVIILHGSHTASLKSDIWTYISKCIHEEHIRAGASNSSMDLQNIPILYEQALFALSCCSAGSTGVTLYKDVLVEHLLGSFSKTHSSSRYLHPYINYLNTYDQKHDSQLVETLYYYLFHNRSHLACAKALHIHKSTFLYRLNTITSLLPIAFDDPEECLNLMLSARILLTRKKSLERIAQ